MWFEVVVDAVDPHTPLRTFICYLNILHFEVLSIFHSLKLIHYQTNYITSNSKVNLNYTTKYLKKVIILSTHILKCQLQRTSDKPSQQEPAENDSKRVRFDILFLRSMASTTIYPRLDQIQQVLHKSETPTDHQVYRNVWFPGTFVQVDDSWEVKGGFKENSQNIYLLHFN